LNQERSRRPLHGHSFDWGYLLVDQATVSPLGGAVRAFWCSSTRSPPADTRMELRMRPRQALDEGSRIALLETVTRPQRWLRLLDHGSGDCPTTVWYRSSFLMLSDPLSAHPDACGVSDAPSGVAESARGKRCNGYTMSAEVVASWTRRLHHHRMGSGDARDGHTLVRQPFIDRNITKSLPKPYARPPAGMAKCNAKVVTATR